LDQALGLTWLDKRVYIFYLATSDYLRDSSILGRNGSRWLFLLTNAAGPSPFLFVGTLNRH
jgi:hypothetical protein